MIRFPNFGWFTQSILTITIIYVQAAQDISSRKTKSVKHNLSAIALPNFQNCQMASPTLLASHFA